MPETKKPKVDLRRIGTTGLPVWHGRVYDELLRELDGEQGRRVLREMSEQDAIVGGTLLGIEMLARQVPWTVKPADQSNKAQDVAEFVDGALTDMHPTWGSTLSEILSMLVYGWSWLEIIYKRRVGLKPGSSLKSSRFDDDKIGWAGWSIRSQETLHEWVYENEDDTGELIGMRQQAPPNYKIVEIPRSKSLHFTTRSRRENPEGMSILRNAYRAWHMKKNLEAIEGIGIERDLAGLPVLWAPTNLFGTELSAEESTLFEALKKIVTSIKRDEQEGILMPLEYDDEGKNPRYKLELLSTGGERQFDTNAIISRYDERIAMSMLADFILMGHQAVGSFALSATKTGLFSTALSSILGIIADEVNAQAVPRLVILNGWNIDKCPTLQPGKVETADLSKLGDFLKQLADAGMMVFPNTPLEVHLLKMAGLPGDPGAGKLPLPGEQPQLPAGAKLPAQVPQLPAGAPAPQARPAPAPKPPATGRRAASEEDEQEEETETVKGQEPDSRPRHFTPLSVRAAKVHPVLKEQLEPEAYSAFLTAVMEAGKFSKLPGEYQELIRQAESAS